MEKGYLGELYTKDQSRRLHHDGMWHAEEVVDWLVANPNASPSDFIKWFSERATLYDGIKILTERLWWQALWARQKTEDFPTDFYVQCK